MVFIPMQLFFLNVVPDTIDVNIHPQKLQVKFSEPQVVYNELARAVRETLRQFTGYQLYVDKRESALLHLNHLLRILMART